MGIDLCHLEETLQHVHEHSPVPGDDLLQVERLQLLPRRLKRRLQVSKGVCNLLPRLLAAGLPAAGESAGGIQGAGALGAGEAALGGAPKAAVQVVLRLAAPVPGAAQAAGARGLAAHRATLEAHPRHVGGRRRGLQQRREGQVRGDRAQSPTIGATLSVVAQQQDLHQGVLHLPDSRLVHGVKGNLVRTGVLDLRVLRVVEEAPQRAHHLRDDLRPLVRQLVGADEGLHLLQEALGAWGRGRGHETLVPLQVQQVQRHQPLCVLPLHHCGHEVAYGSQREEVLGEGYE
mmetsp:Transcript_68766/g.212642  ORF Transcript_68766/g.212642 Transcript_68766/m.212642 type:complete len:289 (+) Transcript_68766:755-1621(+)